MNDKENRFWQNVSKNHKYLIFLVRDLTGYLGRLYGQTSLNLFENFNFLILISQINYFSNTASRVEISII